MLNTINKIDPAIVSSQHSKGIARTRKAAVMENPCGDSICREAFRPTSRVLRFTLSLYASNY